MAHRTWAVMVIAALIVGVICHDRDRDPHGTYHECIQEKLPDVNVLVPQNHDIESMKRSVAQGGTQWSTPMRIRVDYSFRDSFSCNSAGTVVRGHTCTADDILTTEKEEYLKQIVEAAVQFYQDTLYVYPISPLNILTGSACGGEVVIPNSLANLTAVDFVLIVTARPTGSATTLATAATCQSDTIWDTGVIGRPIVGHANFGVKDLVPNNPLELEKTIGVAIHELAHALGFSSHAFSRGYIRWTSTTTFQELPPNEVTATSNGRSYIITPKVVAAARAHFDCPTLIGGELESAGGAGTAGAHWSKRFYMNEFMTGTASDFPLYSQMTFSLFEDTGYYRVNWPRVSTLVWGRHMGCPFVEDCNNWPSTSQKEGYRCSATGSPSKQCTFDLRGVGQCSEGVLINPLLGSCTYYIDREAGRCDNPYEDPLSLKLDAGEVHARHSRCFVSNVLKLSKQIAGSGALFDDYKCYATTCAGKQRLKVGIEGVWYDCPYNGGNVEPLYYGGRIACKPYAADLICLDAEEDSTWPTVESVTPDRGGPLTEITITGTNFQQTAGVTVQMHGACTDVVVHSDTLITCKVPDKSNFASLDILKDAFDGSGKASTKLTVVVKDDRGFTGMLRNGYTLEMDSLDAAQNWIEQNLILFICLCVGFVLIVVVIAVLIYKCCCKKKGKGGGYR